ncbi:MAG: hypothetical protein WA584_23610 [Pyrinomonadaceae bacterium]
MATLAEQCVEIYRQKLMIHQVAEETGLPWHVVYRHLKNAGILNIETRLVAGSATDRMGAFYENEFRALVPAAKCENDRKKQFEYDFLVGKAKVEIKSSSLHHHKNRRYWKFQVYTRSTRMRTADYYVCFGKNPGENPKDYVIFCFPAEFLRGGSVNVSPDVKSEWTEFRINPSDLSAMFEEIAND